MPWNVLICNLQCAESQISQILTLEINKNWENKYTDEQI